MLKVERQAIEGALGDALAGMGLVSTDVAWPNKKFDPAGRDIWLRVTHHPTSTRAKTLGPNPREEAMGFTKISIFIARGRGPDEGDDLAEKIVAAYPYSPSPQKDGVTVHIRRRDIMPAVDDEKNGWWYRPVDIYWTVWRTT